MAIKDYRVFQNFHLKNLRIDDEPCSEDDSFVKAFTKIIDEYECASRIILKSYFETHPEESSLDSREKLVSFIINEDSLFDSLLSNGGRSFMSIDKNEDNSGEKKIYCWWITTSDGHINTIKTIYDKQNGVTIHPDDYFYYFLFESEAEELKYKLQLLIKQYSNRKYSKNNVGIKKKSVKLKKKLSMIRYMADSSGCDGRGFSHGFEALLDYQLSWNCRIACYGHDNPDLKKQCDHILNVLVDPRSDKKGSSIIDKLGNLYVYKQWDKTDLIIELYAKEGQTFQVQRGKYERLIILVEDKAFTNITKHQLIDYPSKVKESYNDNTEWQGVKYKILLRVVTLQEQKNDLKNQVKEITHTTEWKVLNDRDLLLKNKRHPIYTNHPLFDAFWIEDRCPVDPGC